MVQTLFETDQPLVKHTTVTYNLQPSQQLVNIRSVLASRKRKSNILSSSSSIPVDSNDDVGKKQDHVYDDTYSGLPSPPVDNSLDDFSVISKHKLSQSPPLTPNTTFSTCSSVTTDNDNPLMEEMEDGLLSPESIKSKLAALREEKHNMFQLLKRLVEQEEQQQQQQQQKQQQQQDIKKKKTSRWSTPTTSPLSYRPSPLSLHQVNNNNSTTSRHSTISTSASTFNTLNTHTGTHAYLSGQQSTQRSPFLY